MSHSPNTTSSGNNPTITIYTITDAEGSTRTRIAAGSTVRSVVVDDLRMNVEKVDITVNGDSVELDDILDDGDNLEVHTKHYNSGSAI